MENRYTSPSPVHSPSPAMENRPHPSVPAILVIGANGGIGRQTVDIALARGYQVTALLRNPANLPLIHPSLQIVKGGRRRALHDQ